MASNFVTDNDDVIDYVIYLASRELRVSVSDEEEEKMIGRLVSQNSETQEANRVSQEPLCGHL